MRVFAALPLPLPPLPRLAAAIEPVRLAYPRLRWVPPSAYHLTVHFFGDLPDPAVAALKALLLDPGLRVPAIPARFGLLGQFPEQGTARVVHASLEQGAEEARAFYDVFHRLAAPLGYQPEARGFAPHITLARAPSGAPVRPPAAGWETGSICRGMDS